MGKVVKVLLWSAVVLFSASLATCHFGVRYEINQIAPEVRAGMGDTDWVGVEWIERGAVLFLVSALSLVAGLVLLAVRKYKVHKSSRRGASDGLGRA